MSQSPKSTLFIRELTACQNALHAYILSLLPDHDLAQDALQDTNELLWRKADEFVSGTNFLAWACTVARYKVLEKRRSIGRDRLVFDGQLVEMLATAADSEPSVLETGRVSRALDGCLQKLTPRQRGLLHHRYAAGASVAALAAQQELSARGLSVTLHRIRRSLLACIEQRLAEESE